VESSVNSKIRPRVERTDLFVDIDFSPESANVDGKDLIVLTRFTISIQDRENGASSTVIEVFAVFEATYSIMTTGYIPTKAQIEAFRSGNAIFNCWPYFREYIHSIFVRMGFPPPPVPFLRLVPKQQVPSDDEKALTLQPSKGVKVRRTGRKRQVSPRMK
jgi:hypothetical protein